jgi:chromosome segregation ATPase
MSALREETDKHDLEMHLQVSELREETRELKKILNQEKRRRPPNDDIIQEINEELQSIQVEINTFQEENLDWREANKLSKKRLKVKKRNSYRTQKETTTECANYEPQNADLPKKIQYTSRSISWGRSKRCLLTLFYDGSSEYL